MLSASHYAIVYTGANYQIEGVRVFWGFVLVKFIVLTFGMY